MYEELISVLRHCGNGKLPCESCPKDRCETGAMGVMNDAADAIEELNRQLAIWKERAIEEFNA